MFANWTSTTVTLFHLNAPFHIVSLIHLRERDERIRNQPTRCLYYLLYSSKEDFRVSSLQGGDGWLLQWEDQWSTLFLSFLGLCARLVVYIPRCAIFRSCKTSIALINCTAKSRAFFSLYVVMSANLSKTSPEFNINKTTWRRCVRPEFQSWQ